MKSQVNGSTESDRPLRALALLIVTWCLMIQAFGPVWAAPDAIGTGAPAVAVAFTSTSTAAGTAPRVLSDVQLAQTIGAGFWSSLWEGMKESWDVILWAGVFITIAVLCHNGEVGCYDQ